jgi:peptidyl-prolyl cis-trans isomerase B (cyclophilin B)
MFYSIFNLKNLFKKNHFMKTKVLMFGFLLMTIFSFNGFTQDKAGVKPKTAVKPAAQTKAVAAKPNPYTAGKTKVKITTSVGTIIIKLYDSTPQHRDNFAKLVKEGFYDSLLFHRVIQGFMIQGGDPMSKTAVEGAMLGMGGGEMERIPAEFNKNIIHKKGALCAARDGNPTKASSACQFYLVQGNLSNEGDLFNMEQSKGITYSADQKNMYKTLGGTPFLDMDYTVFGETISGLEVIDKIALMKTDGNNRPLVNVMMKMEIVK